MKKTTKISIVGFAGLLLVISMVAFGTYAIAAGEQGSQGVPEEISGNKYQGSIAAGTPKTFRFQQKTQLRFNASIGLTLNLECDAANIGEQVLDMSIEADTASTLTMICTETQAELGLQKGQTVQVRNQERAQSGVVCNLSLQGGKLIKAQLKLQMMEQKGYVWAFYNETAKTWEEVPTQKVDGYAVATVDHFSTWTVFTYTESTIDSFAFLLPITAAAVVALVLIQKRRHK